MSKCKWWKISSPVFVLITILLVLVQRFSLKQPQPRCLSRWHGTAATIHSPISSAGSNASVEFNSQCKFFLAESSIPRSGLGVYTGAVHIKKGEPAQPTPDICLYITDAEEGPEKTEIVTHTWQHWRFGASFETRYPGKTRAACQGLVTLFNSMPDRRYAGAKPAAVRNLIHSHAGLRRDTSPGAGAITHYYGASSVALQDLPPGVELLLWDNTWGESGKRGGKKGSGTDETHSLPPVRTLEWLHRYGMCIDNLRPGPATDPAMGRGAFATRLLPKGVVVAPAPLQVFRDRSEFGKKSPEQLFVNYCFQPRGSQMLLFPYGPNFGLINHSKKKKNVLLRWSTFYLNHERWLDLSIDQFWEMQYPGSLMVEAIALRDIREGEEIYMDYGDEWENAWNDHVRNWKPVANAKRYAYPADMDLSAPFRTVAEQRHSPYPKNLMTVCDTFTLNRPGNTVVEWKQNDEDWPSNVVDCEILARTNDNRGSYVYNVSLWTKWDATYIDYNVRHEAISFVDRPYKSDQHLKNAFRHPIGLPAEMTPQQWRGD